MSSNANFPAVPRPPAAIPAGSSSVIGAIRNAAQATGTNFDHLLATAKIESDLNPNLTMRTSTATGLFQFLEQTWLETMKTAGHAFGYGKYADGISETKSGRYVVEDPNLRNEIMKLRKDPSANAVMGGAITRQNQAVLSHRIGRQPTEGELYVAHFFGPYTASKVINQTATNPTANAAAMYPAAARANHSIFYDKQGNARSIAGVYSELVRRYQVARASPTPGLPAMAAASPENVVAANAPDIAGITSAYADASAASANIGTAFAQSDPDVFHSLFQTGERRGALSPMLASLWTAQGTDVTPAPSGAKLGAQGSGAPLDLFQDMPPSVRGLFDGGA